MCHCSVSVLLTVLSGTSLSLFIYLLFLYYVPRMTLNPGFGPWLRLPPPQANVCSLTWRSSSLSSSHLDLERLWCDVTSVDGKSAPQKTQIHGSLPPWINVANWCFCPSWTWINTSPIKDICFWYSAFIPMPLLWHKTYSGFSINN